MKLQLHTYLNEGMRFDKIDDGNKMADFIKENCKPFLKEWSKNYHNYQLYTGRKIKDDWYIKTVRKNRIPKDTPNHIHDFFNEYFKEHFGINLRSESLFCTSDMSIAGDYGGRGRNIYVIIPIGKYDLYYNKDIEDLFSDVHEEGYLDNYLNGEWIDDDWSNAEEEENKFYKLMGGYKKGNLKEAVNSKVEVMLYTKKVILIHVNEIDPVIEELIG